MRIRRATTIASVAFAIAFAESATTRAGGMSQQAQTPNRTTKASSRTSNGDTTTSMTVVGCLIQESDYQRAHGLGKGALNGAGLGDEFVLVNASAASSPSDTNSAASGSTSTPSTRTPSATAETCAETSGGEAYRMTGNLEKQLKPFVGHRVQVTGHFDHPRDARTAAGETNATLPAEIAIVSYREAAPTSTPAAAAQAPPTTSAQPQEARNEPAPRQLATNTSLPHTAGHEPLIALLGFLLLTAGVGVSVVRRRAL